MDCLDIGCGGGDVAFDLARLVAPGGRVVGVDIDKIKVKLAQREAREQHLTNVEFRLVDITERDLPTEFDFIYARFVLTHLRHPAKAVAKMYNGTRPGGVLCAVDIDFRGYFCYPDCVALKRYVELYTQAVERRGGDANIGPRLPELLNQAGVRGVQMNVVQPTGTEGEVKLVTPITMENIADAVLDEGLASRREIDQIVAQLYEFADDPSTVLSAPRIVETWGYRPRA
jgi:SAM-dependent methyltransferase